MKLVGVVPLQFSQRSQMPPLAVLISINPLFHCFFTLFLRPRSHGTIPKHHLKFALSYHEVSVYGYVKNKNTD